MADLATKHDADSRRESSLERPRRSFGLPLSPLVLIDALSRKTSVPYDKLPEEPLSLTVLKLDGSFFDIQVSKTANVGELKLAVEAVFGHLPQKGPAKISWPHVWAHFCLCYDGQKLAMDSDQVRDFGIKDSDQLCFARHVSISYNLVKKRRPRTRFAASKQKNVRGNETERSNSQGKLGADQGCFAGRRKTRLRSAGKTLVVGQPNATNRGGFLGGFKKAVVRCCCKMWRHRTESLGNVSSSKRYLVK